MDDFPSNEDVNPEDLLNDFGKWIKKHPELIVAAVVVVLLLFSIPTMVFQVDRDEEAVVLRFGAFARRVDSGLRWKFPPPIETVFIVNTQRVFSEQFGYRGEERAGSSKRSVKEESLILTGDLGVSRLEWDILYRKTDPMRFLFNIRDESKILRKASLSSMRRVVGDFNATEVITVRRRQIALKVKNQLQNILDNYRSGITIADVVIQSSEPPDPVAPAFQEVDSARQVRDQMRHQANRHREKVINEAEGQVSQMVSEALGDSAAVINRALGDANRFNSILTQYRQAPEITRQRMFLETMQQVITNGERIYVIDEKVKGLLPLLELKGDVK